MGFFKSQVQGASKNIDDQDIVAIDKDETKTISEDLEKMNIDENGLEPETDDDAVDDWVFL